MSEENCEGKRGNERRTEGMRRDIRWSNRRKGKRKTMVEERAYAIVGEKECVEKDRGQTERMGGEQRWAIRKRGDGIVSIVYM